MLRPDWFRPRTLVLTMARTGWPGSISARSGAVMAAPERCWGVKRPGGARFPGCAVMDTSRVRRDTAHPRTLRESERSGGRTVDGPDPTSTGEVGEPSGVKDVNPAADSANDAVAFEIATDAVRCGALQAEHLSEPGLGHFKNRLACSLMNRHQQIRETPLRVMRQSAGHAPHQSGSRPL